MSSGEASHLRGILQWIHTGVSGRPIRGALTALTARQYYEQVTNDVLTRKLREALVYILRVLEVMPSRISSLTDADESRQVLVYTDAATLPTGLRVGILLTERNHKPVCSVYDVPEHVVQTWALRSTYIGQGELIAGPLALLVYADRMS